MHVRYFSVDVVFYGALFDVLISGAISGLLFFFLAKNVFSPFEKSLLIVVFLLAGYSLAISVPAVIDRSLSFYILEKLQQRGGGIRLDRLGDVFTHEYLVEHRLVDVRVTEQVQSGNIVVDGECVRLTDRGARLAAASRYFRQNFLPKRRLLMGEYTDALTDPFRNSTLEFDYGCD
jgi:hypothetical protein